MRAAGVAKKQWHGIWFGKENVSSGTVNGTEPGALTRAIIIVRALWTGLKSGEMIIQSGEMKWIRIGLGIGFKMRAGIGHRASRVEYKVWSIGW